jgi:hypothetical protein
MPFKALKKYILHQLSDDESGENFDFSNSFSDVLQHETTHQEPL